MSFFPRVLDQRLNSRGIEYTTVDSILTLRLNPFVYKHITSFFPRASNQRLGRDDYNYRRNEYSHCQYHIDLRTESSSFQNEFNVSQMLDERVRLDAYEPQGK